MTNLICRLSGHKYGPLTYSQSSSKCVSERVCVRCAEKATLEQDHDWGQWRENEMMDCEKRALWRECQRCGRIETKNLGHDWGSWQREGAKPCTEMRTCSRCGKRETKALPHEYGAWAVHKQCEQVRICKHCGSEEYKQVHNRDTKRVGTCQIVEYCRTCGKRFSTQYEHTFLHTRDELDANGLTVGWHSQCVGCGERDYNENPHYRSARGW